MHQVLKEVIEACCFEPCYFERSELRTVVVRSAAVVVAVQGSFTAAARVTVECLCFVCYPGTAEVGCTIYHFAFAYCYTIISNLTSTADNSNSFTFDFAAGTNEAYCFGSYTTVPQSVIMGQIIDFDLAAKNACYSVIAPNTDVIFVQLQAAVWYEKLERLKVECSSKLHCQLKFLSSSGHFQ